jgi:hypothetical protein
MRAAIAAVFALVLVAHSAQAAPCKQTKAGTQAARDAKRVAQASTGRTDRVPPLILGVGY